jgi:hypothetical protein
MMRKLLLVGLALSALGLMQATPASAAEWGKQSVLMFSQAATLTLIVLIGCVGICLASLLMHFRKPVLVGNR